MTPPRRIGIVSSADVSCGNAAFTKVLAHSLSARPGVEVEVLGLDLELTQSRAPTERRLADAHIDDICTRMRKLDGVNIQFEPGLYGARYDDIERRYTKLLDAHPNVYVTLHAVRTLDRGRAALKMRESMMRLMTFKVGSAAAGFIEACTARREIQANRRYIAIPADRRCPIIVHTARSSRRIHHVRPDASTHIHPLRMAEPGTCSCPDFIDRLKARLALQPHVVTLGLFGYYGGYKGMDTAIRALSRLPSHHHLLIFGKQHPQTIRQGEPVSSVVARLIALVDKLQLQHRVHFLGELNDLDFINAAAGVDAVWLPYLEVDQDGSGIAAIAFDVAKRIFASHSAAFDELLRLIPYEGVERFDIGNDLELAQKTKTSTHLIQRPNTPYTIRSQAELYYRLSLPRHQRDL